MSTRSIIAIQTTDNIKATYCHWDGHLDSVGKTIQENYLDENKVNQLIDLGRISSLRSEIGEKHPFDTPHDQNLTDDELDLKRDEHVALYGHMTTFYKRDRGDDDVSPFIYDSPNDLLMNAPDDSNAELIYLFADNEWQVASIDTNWNFKLLTSQLKENNIIFITPPDSSPIPTSAIIQLGKVDATDNGIKDNAVDIQIKLEDGKFTASGSIWNRLKSDIIAGGQNLDEIAGLFPDNVTVAKIHTIWKKYHLNDMNAGTQLQEDWIAQQKESGNLDQNPDYEIVCDALKAHGLYEVVHKGEPYAYGSAWISQEIPDSIQDEIINIIKNNNSKNKPTKKSKNNDFIENAVDNLISF